MANVTNNGCPLSVLSPKEKGYCGTCPQQYDCILWTILRKLEDIEKLVKHIQLQTG
jgi:hypothetical protein